MAGQIPQFPKPRNFAFALATWSRQAMESGTSTDQSAESDSTLVPASALSNTTDRANASAARSRRRARFENILGEFRAEIGDTASTDDEADDWYYLP